MSNKDTQCPFCGKINKVGVHTTSIPCGCGHTYIVNDLTAKRTYP